MILEARSPKSAVLRAMLPSEALGHAWLVAGCHKQLHFLPTRPHGLLHSSVSFSAYLTYVIAFRALPHNPGQTPPLKIHVD